MTDIDDLIAENRKWVELHYRNKYQAEAARRMTRVLDALESSRPRVIDTAEELDALPSDSVVKASTGRVMHKQRANEYPWCGADDTAEMWTSIGLAAAFGHWRVLYEPREG